VYWESFADGPSKGLHTLTLKIEEACTSKTFATSSTTIQCNNPRTKLISVISHCENWRSVISASFNVQYWNSVYNWH
jgi:hypothetical protein